MRCRLFRVVPRPSAARPLSLLAAALMPALLAAMLLTPRPAAAGPSYQRLVTDEPARTSWRDGLTVSFVMDEAQCRRAYGRAWPQECAAALPGSEGMRAAGVQLTPRTPGEWRWLSPGIMRFTPSTPDGALAPNTRYRIDVGGMRLPPRLRLAQTVVDYVTQPQAASPGEERIWIDPSPAAAHGVSLALTFIWPADRARVEERVRLAPSDSASGLRLGETRYSWSAGGDSVVVSARVLSLPAKDSRISLALGGLPVWSLNRSGERVLREPSGRPAYSFGMPGTSGLFSFKSISLVRGHDQLLNIRHELDFSTTLRVDPKTLLDALTVVELPEKAEPGAAVPTDWTAMPGLSPRDLEAGRRLEPRLVSGTEPSDRVRVAVPVGAGRCAAVLISGKLASVGGPGLKADVIRILKAPDSAAELSFLQPGNILALGGSGRIALHCTGLDSLRWRARRVRTPFLAMFAATRGFSAQASEDWRADDSLDSLTETGTGRLDLQPGPEGQAVFPLLDLRDLLPGLRGAPGLLHLELEGLRGGRTVVRASRMLLATNIGLIVKEEADGRRLVFVQSLSTGLAASGLKTQLLARNGAVLAEAESNASGLAVLPAAGDREGEREPVAVIARTQGTSQDLAWLSLKDRSRVLDNGEFSVRGRHGTEAGLLASVFSQRDLYMPGEMLHFGIMVRRFDWKPLPAGLPLETILTDPAGRVLQRQPLVGRPDLAEVSWKSPAGASTGPYRLDVRIRGDDGQGPVLGSCSVRVEEFEPDTLSMTCELTPAVRRGWIRTGQGAAPAARVTLRTLYGEAARQHTLRPSFTVSPARLTFPGYEGYSFCDPSLDAGETRELRLPQASTDDEGRAEVSLPVSSVAGTFLGTLRVEGYEAAGGRAVTRQVPALFSPLSVIMGYRPTGRAGTLESIPQGEKAGLRIAALNSRLEPAALEGLTCTIASRRYINTLVRDSRGEFRYETAPLDRKLRSAGIELADGRADIALRTQEAGDFVLTVTGSRGETLLSVPYTVAGRDLRPAGDGTSDSMTDGNLRLRLARDSYEPGEDIVLRFSAPFAGSGLITIEREKVVSSVWFRCEAGESEQHIRVPADFEGQGYVNLLFSRAATSDAIYLKPVAHAAAPFSCGLRRRDMGLRLEAPQSVAPGGSMEVLLRSRKPGRVLLFAVDEGILSLTGFASPNPLKDLLCGRALDVVTRQTFDLLMPDSQRLAGRLPAFGGGMSMTGGRFLNPFRRRTEPPFAWWLGFADVGPDGTRVAIHVPSYLSGRIRVMAVGTSDADSLLAAGSAEAAVAVRGSLLVRPVLPLAVSPGDVFSCAVTVANTVAGSGRDVPVTLTITPKSALELVEGSAEHSLTISENEEVTVPFTLRAGDVLGSAGVVFAARIAGEEGAPGTRASMRVQSLSIRPPSPLLTTESFGALGKDGDGTEREISADRDIYSLSASAALTVSPAPLAAFRTLASKLGDYPFSCTEQRLSRAFPFAAALLRPELEEELLAEPGTGPEQRGQHAAMLVEEAVAGLRAAMNWDGAALWPGGEGVDFVTVYAGDFLMSLVEGGRGVPGDLLEQILRRLQRIVSQEPDSRESARIRAYACWVLMRSGAIVTQDVERLHGWLEDNWNGWRQDVTASLVADCLAMLRLSDAARALMPAALAPVTDSDGYLNSASCWALHSYICSQDRWKGSADVPERAKSAAAAMNEAVDRSLSGSADTISMALTARALAGAISAPASRTPVTLRCIGQEAGSAPVLTVGGLNMLQAPGCRRFGVTPPADLEGLFWHLRVTGYDRTPSAAVSSGLEVRRRYLNEQGRAATSVREGETVTVEIEVRSASRLNNVSVVDLLPGGLEPLLHQPRTAADGSVAHSERREDRMLFFVETGPDPLLLTYQARATIAGTFRIPALSAEAMYDPSFNASDPGGTLTVMPR